MQVDALIRQLLALTDLNDDTAADLRRMLAESEAGTLDAADADYVRALHAKLTDGTIPEASDDAAEETADGLSLADWRDRALRAEAEVAALRDQLASIPS